MCDASEGPRPERVAGGTPAEAQTIQRKGSISSKQTSAIRNNGGEVHLRGQEIALSQPLSHRDTDLRASDVLNGNSIISQHKGGIFR